MFEVTTVTSVTNSLHTIFDEYDGIKERIETVGAFVHDRGDTIRYFIEGNTSSISSYEARKLFNIENAVKALDADFWSRVMTMTDVLDFMPNKKRNEWNESIREHKTPPFERLTVIDTVQNLIGSRESFLAEKIEGVFNVLSPNHKTNNPMAFMDRMIIENIVDKFGLSNSNKIGYIHDLRASIAKLQHRDEPNHSLTHDDIMSIVKNNAYGTWFDFDGGNFKLRVYKKGTVHLEVHPDVADQLNRLLASRGPAYIASFERSQDTKFRRKAQPLRKIEVSQPVLLTIRRVIDRWDNGNDTFYIGLHDLSKNQKEEFWKVMDCIGGEDVGGNLKFDFNPVPALQYICRMGLIPDKKAYQFYPTPGELVHEMQCKLRKLNKYNRNILEPSAGTGNLIKGLGDYGFKITCVEIDPVRCEVLKSISEDKTNGIQQVICGDFLQWPNATLFDGIIMNPPFSENQAINHVKKAWNHLAPGGYLVACLPASLKGKEIIPGFYHQWSVLFEDQFEDTSVRVVVLTMKKLSDDGEEDEE